MSGAGTMPATVATGLPGRRQAWMVGAMTAVLLLLALAVALVLRNVLVTQRTIERNLGMIAHVESLRGALNGAAAETRAYASTGDERYLGLRDAALADYRRQLATLRGLTGGQPELDKALDRVERAAEGRVGIMQAMERAHRADGEEAAERMLESDLLWQAVGEMRLAVDAIGELARAQLDEQRAIDLRAVRMLAGLGGMFLALAIATLAIAFLRLRQELATSASLAEATRQSESRLQERTLQLELTVKELESFSYSVSHDLRAPLRAMDGFAELLEQDCGERVGDQGRRYINVIRNAAARMAGMISDLLEFARLARVPLRKQTVDVRPLVELAVEQALAGRQDRRPAVVIGDLPDCEADPGLLQQVWQNLVDNAVKYSGRRDDARVEIDGGLQHGEVVYRVADNGAGFDMRYADKLFGVFQRLHHADEFPGTGVGLALVARILARHGGRIWAEAAPGRGATFRFALPAREKA